MFKWLKSLFSRKDQFGTLEDRIHSSSGRLLDHKPIKKPSTRAQEITEAFQQATEKAVLEHHQAGRSVPIIRHGEDKITFVSPADSFLTSTGTKEVCECNDPDWNQDDPCDCE